MMNGNRILIRRSAELLRNRRKGLQINNVKGLSTRTTSIGPSMEEAVIKIPQSPFLHKKNTSFFSTSQFDNCQQNTKDAAGSDRQDHDEFTRTAEKKKEDEERRRRNEDEDFEVKKRILDAAMVRVPEYGWTIEAVRAGAKDAGLPEVTAGLIERGGIDLVHFHMTESNEKLELLMAEEKQRVEAKGERIKIGPFVKTMAKKRLEMNIPIIDRWGEGLALGGCPTNLAESAKIDLDLFDAIWYYAGDKATDMNWYSKRTILGLIYKSTELAMVQEAADTKGKEDRDFAATWEFLDRRFEDHRDFTQALSLSRIEDVQNMIQGGLITLKNLSGAQRN